ncbi:unnamed protein product [Protopolystoma xenopodis]|uniref:Uncharacterized protein n=1 Tax=Protopolystoma xenopodis TaxID=117903 RepID=A0A3S5CSR5_9PLAT|nr:unnamed protein product [Protopolystoma xenopodis]
MWIRGGLNDRRGRRLVKSVFTAVFAPSLDNMLLATACARLYRVRFQDHCLLVTVRGSAGFILSDGFRLRTTSRPTNAVFHQATTASAWIEQELGVAFDESGRKEGGKYVISKSVF